MIFVSLGTQDKPFTRLLDILEHSNISEEIIVQAGFTKYSSKKMQIFEYMEPDDFDKYLNESRIVICHGGVGTIMKALNLSKTVIACSRLSKYGEHQNDHQKQIVANFAEHGYIMALNEKDDIDEIIKRADLFTPEKICSNKKVFLSKFEKYLETI